MATCFAPVVDPALPRDADACAGAVALLRAAVEAVVLVMVGVSPWCYGAVHPGFEFLLSFGLGVVLALWGARMVVEGRLRWKKCPVALCLAGLFLLGVWQVTPL